MSTPGANTSPPNALSTQNQDRLRSHFDGHNDAAHPNRWDALWKEGTFLPWDRGFANPALVDALNEKPRWLPSPLNADGSKKRALVPGCGKGYDLVLLAAHGYDAYGIEISENAKRIAEEWLKNPGEGKEGEYKVKGEKVGRGKTEMLLGDFFKDDWAQGAGGVGKGFDLIYDCTFLSALPPSMRAAWALRMTELLAPEGILICLEFPTHKNPKSGGPPWALPSTVYDALFRRPGDEIEYNEDGIVVAETRPENDKALYLVTRWKPDRTHAVGIIQGDVRDRVSVWVHKSAVKL